MDFHQDLEPEAPSPHMPATFGSKPVHQPNQTADYQPPPADVCLRLSSSSLLVFVTIHIISIIILVPVPLSTAPPICSSLNLYFWHTACHVV